MTCTQDVNLACDDYCKTHPHVHLQMQLLRPSHAAAWSRLCRGSFRKLKLSFKSPASTSSSRSKPTPAWSHSKRSFQDLRLQRERVTTVEFAVCWRIQLRDSLLLIDTGSSLTGDGLYPRLWTATNALLSAPPAHGASWRSALAARG